MTRAHSVRAGIIAVTVLVVVTVCVLLMSHRSQARSLSLVFERYGTTPDLLGKEVVAFLRFTNWSDKTYVLLETGGTNTFLQDSFGSYKGSHMVECEFSDQAKPKVSITSWRRCMDVEPHSSVRIRVALPPKGQTRKVAVLCAEQPPMNPRLFWTHGIGLRILAVLPRSVGRKLLFSWPKLQRVWCDRELSYPVS